MLQKMTPEERAAFAEKVKDHVARFRNPAANVREARRETNRRHIALGGVWADQAAALAAGL